MSCEFRIFRHFVTIFFFRMSYLLNQTRFSKMFFTFKFFSEYYFKIANLLWHKLKLIFCFQSYDVIFASKTVKIKNTKTYDCWENKVLLSCKVSAQTVKNWKTSLKEITVWWQLTRQYCAWRQKHNLRRSETLSHFWKMKSHNNFIKMISGFEHYFRYLASQPRRAREINQLIEQ